MVFRILPVVASLVLAACGDMARLPSEAGEGANPTLPPPVRSLIPTVNIAPAQGWPEGAMPTAPASTPSGSTEEKSGLGSKAIIGIAIAVLGVLVLIAGAVVMMNGGGGERERPRRRRRRDDDWDD